MATNRGLGKGLSALFSAAEAEYENSTAATETEGAFAASITAASRPAPSPSAGPVPGVPRTLAAGAAPAGAADSGKPLMVPLDKVYANPDQPRKVFDQTALQELSDSIKQHGVIQPIVVTQRGEKYMIIAGERRFRASRLAGLKQIPVFVKELTDQNISEVSLIENLQREDLNAVEAAKAVRQLMDNFSLTQEEVAKRIGKSRPAVANLLRILTLPEEVADLVTGGSLSEGQARCLVGLEPRSAVSLAQQAIRNNMTVRELEKAVRELGHKKGLDTFGFKRPGKTEEPAAPAQSRELKDLIITMQRVLGTKVTAIGSDDKGRIYIDYFTRDDLERIFVVMEKAQKK